VALDEQLYQRLGGIAVQCAEAAYVAIEGIGRISPVVHALADGRSRDPEAELAGLRAFAEEVSVQLAFLARTVAEEPGFEQMPWQYDARVILPVLYEMAAVYLLLTEAFSEDDLNRLPPVSKSTLQRLATKERRAWLHTLIGVS
jgi:hypothetical protein